MDGMSVSKLDSSSTTNRIGLLAVGVRHRVLAGVLVLKTIMVALAFTFAAEKPVAGYVEPLYARHNRL